MAKESSDSSLEYLYGAVLSLENVEQCRDFLNDLCTTQELKAFAQRLQVAKLLEEKRVYSDIVQETGASTAIVSRVKRSFTLGGNGYRFVFSKLEKK